MKNESSEREKEKIRRRRSGGRGDEKETKNVAFDLNGMVRACVALVCWDFGSAPGSENESAAPRVASVKRVRTRSVPLFFSFELIRLGLMYVFYGRRLRRTED